MINICDAPFDADYKFAIIKGLMTMFILFVFGYFSGRMHEKLID